MIVVRRLCLISAVFCSSVSRLCKLFFLAFHTDINETATARLERLSFAPRRPRMWRYKHYEIILARDVMRVPFVEFTHPCLSLFFLISAIALPPNHTQYLGALSLLLCSFFVPSFSFSFFSFPFFRVCVLEARAGERGWGGGYTTFSN